MSVSLPVRASLFAHSIQTLFILIDGHKFLKRGASIIYIDLPLYIVFPDGDFLLLLGLLCAQSIYAHTQFKNHVIHSIIA